MKAILKAKILKIKHFVQRPMPQFSLQQTLTVPGKEHPGAIYSFSTCLPENLRKNSTHSNSKAASNPSASFIEPYNTSKSRTARA